MPSMLLFILALAALLLTIAHAMTPSKCPLWVPVFLASFVLAVIAWPK